MRHLENHCHFKNLPRSTCLLTMNCRMVKVFPSDALVVVDDVSSCGVGGEL